MTFLDVQNAFESQIFMWQDFITNMQISTALKKGVGVKALLCCVCAKPETVNHILFECGFAQYIWCCIRDAYSLEDFPTSIQDILVQWLPRRLGISRKLSFVFGRIETKWQLKILSSNADAVIVYGCG